MKKKKKIQLSLASQEAPSLAKLKLISCLFIISVQKVMYR